MAILLRDHERRKDGKTNTYWSLVENRRCAGGRVVQRHVLYLGKLTPAQELSWEKTAAQFEDKPRSGEALPGLAGERELQRQEAAAIAVHLKQFRIERPRQCAKRARTGRVRCDTCNRPPSGRAPCVSALPGLGESGGQSFPHLLLGT